MKKYIQLLSVFTIILSFAQCKTQNTGNEPPFKITEKTYFNWVGGKKGTQGFTVQIKGTFDTTILSFSKIYFQNNELTVVPEIYENTFTLIGSKTYLSDKGLTMSGNPVDEYGNQPPDLKKKIPFDLQKNEAVIEYSLSGKVFYYKVKNIKQLETVYYP